MSEPPAGSQTCAQGGSCADVAAGVWTGLDNGNTLLQTGYAYDLTDPGASWCNGVTNGCDYGLFFEFAPVASAGGFQGNPHVSPGDILEEGVDYTGPYENNLVTYGVFDYDLTTGQQWVVSTEVVGSWYPYQAQDILETPSITSGSFVYVAQIPQLDQPAQFENGDICSFSGGCSSLAQAYSAGWSSTYTLQEAASTTNTQEQMQTGSNYWGQQGSFPEVSWLRSTYNFCWMNPSWFNECGGGGGGGGCVAYDTPILTPAGYVPVQQLRPGDAVDEYNFTSHQLVHGRFVSGSTTKVTQLIEVNYGLLRVTPTDQPIYIRNSTYTGWIHDPQNLTTSDSIFDPITQTWIQVTSVQLVNANAIVYDVVTSGANNFIGNGALLDKKV